MSFSFQRGIYVRPAPSAILTLHRMRFLGIGKGNDLADMYLRLQQRGHEVRVFVGDPHARDIFRGMLTFTDDWERDLTWARDGILIFEGIGWGETQDALRRQGYRVIGGSALGDRLETDRAFGQDAMRTMGLQTAPSHPFSAFDDALRFVREHRRRYVLKFSGHGFASTRNYVGEMDSGDDVLAVLKLQRDRWTYSEKPEFILMDHVTGVEVGLGSFFNGRDFLQPANLDWEHKRFFPGNLGELTGEMGTLATYRGAEVLFDRTLRHLAPMLRQSGYVGYINLNTIVNERGIFPLELTCRFGYPGFVILDALHACGWDEIFTQLVAGRDTVLRTRDGFAICVVLTVPTFPYFHGYEQVGKGSPILFRDTMTAGDRDQLHFAEVCVEGEQLVTAGSVGYVMVVTGRGATVEAAREDAYARCEKVVIPNVRYRLDIGSQFLSHDQAEMVRLGLLRGSETL
ncbi:MAG TPA: phosphoribosylglycinamide synthetase C domain-containing protein [Gemmatimonadaceae bacterium]|nr:phosphoribosylglycinamide synthetase C domain-containing protein [Gemmatimonadaceae bacterium]